MDVGGYLYARLLCFQGECRQYLLDTVLGVSSLEVAVNRKIAAGAGSGMP
jgi:hypothetical protein